MTTIESNNPLYLHPSDGSHSIVVEKLIGAENYRAWKRSFEIGLPQNENLVLLLQLQHVIPLIPSSKKLGTPAIIW
ncbi:unnamed protein product [Amaranthus hypochondriacus]